MKFDLQGSCSELIMRLPEFGTKKEILKELKSIGIKQMDIDNFWNASKDSTKKNLLVDKDNPNSPDFENKSNICLDKHKEYDGENIWAIMAHQHCQPELFSTIRKIVKHFNAEAQGYDGGSTNDYEEWIEKGEPKIPNHNKKFQKRREAIIKGIKDSREICEFCGNPIDKPELHILDGVPGHKNCFKKALKW